MKKSQIKNRKIFIDRTDIRVAPLLTDLKDEWWTSITIFIEQPGSKSDTRPQKLEIKALYHALLKPF